MIPRRPGSVAVVASDASLPLAVLAIGMGVVAVVSIINAVREHNEYRDRAKSRQRIIRELRRMEPEDTDA